MTHCAQNAFCCSLDEETRQRLCEHCMVASFGQGSQYKGNFKSPQLLLEGAICVMQNNRPNAIIVPGDFLLVPEFSPSGPYPYAVSETEEQDAYHHQTWHFIVPSKMAFFPSDLVRKLMDATDFDKALINSLLRVQTQLSYYNKALYHSNAYDAVRYGLKLASVYHLGSLTHEEFALITGRNRTTVTKILHEIAQKEPGLLV